MANGSREYPKLNLNIPDSTPDNSDFRPSYRVEPDEPDGGGGGQFTRMPSQVGSPHDPPTGLNLPPRPTDVSVQGEVGSYDPGWGRVMYSKRIPF